MDWINIVCLVVSIISAITAILLYVRIKLDVNETKNWVETMGERSANDHSLYQEVFDHWKESIDALVENNALTKKIIDINENACELNRQILKDFDGNSEDDYERDEYKIEEDQKIIYGHVR